jgi:hypothetical protein
MGGGQPIKLAATAPTEPAGSPDLHPTLTLTEPLTIEMCRGFGQEHGRWTAPVAGVYSMATWPPTLIEEKVMTDPIETAEQDAVRYGPSPTSQGVRGYRDLTPEEVALINTIKAEEELLADVWAHVANLAESDKRWVSVARTHFQEGFSALVRSVAQPEDPFSKAFDTPTS